MIKRYLENKLPKESFFLFGPRQVGKGTLLKSLSNSRFYRNDSPKGLVFIDEIQRVPKLLNVIHL